MTIDATFWVAVSFFLFFGGLVYLKVPQKINKNLKEDFLEVNVTPSSSLSSNREVMLLW